MAMAMALSTPELRIVACVLEFGWVLGDRSIWMNWRLKQDEERGRYEEQHLELSSTLCSFLAARTSPMGRQREQNGVASEEAEEERARARRRLRAEQDAEYQAALLQDQERESRRQQKALRAAQKKREEEEAAAAAAKKELALGDRRRQKAAVLETEPEPGPGVTSVRVRLPNGEHRERMFLNTSTVQVVYDYVDTLMCFDVLSYSLFSSFPRVVYGSGSRNMTLKAAGFHPRVSLFVQVDDDH